MQWSDAVDGRTAIGRTLSFLTNSAPGQYTHEMQYTSTNAQSALFQQRYELLRVATQQSAQRPQGVMFDFASVCAGVAIDC